MKPCDWSPKLYKLYTLWCLPGILAVRRGIWKDQELKVTLRDIGSISPAWVPSDHVSKNKIKTYLSLRYLKWGYFSTPHFYNQMSGFFVGRQERKENETRIPTLSLWARGWENWEERDPGDKNFPKLYSHPHISFLIASVLKGAMWNPEKKITVRKTRAKHSSLTKYLTSGKPMWSTS